MIQTSAVIISAASATSINSMLSGLMTVVLPEVGSIFHLTPKLLLWPVSIYALTNGCTLLLFGTLTDMLGSRRMHLLGNIFQVAMTIGTGLSKTGTQMIVIRALCGVASSLCLPSAVSIVTTALPPGRRRNIAFASMGGGLPIGFGIGLIMGGVCAGTIGWQWGFHITSIFNFLVLALLAWKLPRTNSNNPAVRWRRLKTDVDWIGILIITLALGILLYVLSEITSSVSEIRTPTNIGLLSASLILLPIFALWMHYATNHNLPALIPNSLWSSRIFTSVCLNVFFIWGAFNSVEQYLNFYFQNLQNTSVLYSGIQFLPTCIAGAAANLTMGLIVHRVRAPYIIAIATSLSCIAPLLMALANPKWTYWAAEFPAVALNAIQVDAFYTIANLLITEAFPDETQALAGGVFNTIAQIGKGVGLALSGLVEEGVGREKGLLSGYRVAFWFCFALCLGTQVVSFWGLRGVGKVGGKEG
ncbi:uncharacterized protein BDR25DRAFT_218761 [Lindgomyces ingoldianus]|uniref:Integral membrane protein n=1 Tax=Lindgomyces ingoldianus TaxID=673940 RepID=A0ACB6R3Q8_9PLEO|nr:uncharacterized protein BDR25DRAFT_218761 [Lindgomyces ingoldianus]KAF2473410.1 integral membrane protein [Lindgomyces ingoldianus]